MNVTHPHPARPAVGALALAAGLATTGVQSSTMHDVAAAQQAVRTAAQGMVLLPPARGASRLPLGDRVVDVGDRIRGPFARLCTDLGLPHADEAAAALTVRLEPTSTDRGAASAGARSHYASTPGVPPGRAEITIGSALAARSSDEELAFIAGHQAGRLALLHAQRHGVDLSASPLGRSLQAPARADPGPAARADVQCDRMGQRLADGAGYGRGGVFGALAGMAGAALQRIRGPAPGVGELDATRLVDAVDQGAPPRPPSLLAGRSERWSGFEPSASPPGTPGRAPTRSRRSGRGIGD